MPMHMHVSSHERAWLPAPNGLLEPHPVCRTCGAVKNISSDRAKDVGYYANVLSEIRRYLESKGGKLSQAQIRLIMRELESNEHFTDTYTILGSVQRSMFVRVVQRYTGLSRSLIESFL